MTHFSRFLKVESSNIEAVAYDPASETLGIVFESTSEYVYEYEEVPPKVFAGLVCAESVGAYFSKEIRPYPAKYPFTKRKR